jgi:hypothetical protein
MYSDKSLRIWREMLIFLYKGEGEGEDVLGEWGTGKYGCYISNS